MTKKGTKGQKGQKRQNDKVKSIGQYGQIDRKYKVEKKKNTKWISGKNSTI